MINQPAIPRVTIGMPVYNGALTIAQSIDSLLAQCFDDFELVISDNASTDDSVRIIESYCLRDARVRLIRQSCNVGANGNFSAVVDAARGEYFKWSTCSDLCSPDFLAHCVTLLDTHPDVVLAAPATRLFEANPDDAIPYAGDIEVMGDSPAERFQRLIETIKLNNAMNGLIRSAALRVRHPVIDHYMQADIVMMSCLALQGKLALVPEAVLLRRMDPRTATILMTKEDDIRHHYPAPDLRSLLPAWRLFLGWQKAVHQTPVAAADKRQAYRYIAKMCFWERGRLLRDIPDGIASFLQLRRLGRWHASTKRSPSP